MTRLHVCSFCGLSLRTNAIVSGIGYFAIIWMVFLAHNVDTIRKVFSRDTNRVDEGNQQEYEDLQTGFILVAVFSCLHLLLAVGGVLRNGYCIYAWLFIMAFYLVPFSVFIVMKMASYIPPMVYLDALVTLAFFFGYGFIVYNYIAVLSYSRLLHKKQSSLQFVRQLPSLTMAESDNEIKIGVSKKVVEDLERILDVY